MDIEKLSEVQEPYFAKVFSYIKKQAHVSNIAGDTATPIYTFGSAAIDELRDMQYGEVTTRMIASKQKFETPAEAWNSQLLKITGDMVRIAGSIDEGIGPNTNPIYKWGTLSDPTSYTHAQMPISFSPMESSAVYANGGLPAEIVNKKTRAMVLNGATFKTHNSKFWDGDKIEMLEAAAESTGFNDKAADGICDSFLYGGNALYPVFKDDSPTKMLKPLDKMLLEKGCIDRWVNADRWNITTVPSFIITARDYLNPDTILIPMANVELNTKRVCMIRPKSLPYWAAIFNLGWCPPDLNGWMRSYYSYEITQMSVPVMAQQMSLLLYRMPLDALNATIGKEGVEKLMAVNEQKMAEWNSLNPKAVNMVGEVEVVNRTYSGFDLFVGATKSELAAQCGLPEPSLWHTPNKGFSDNTQESLLKQSETLKMNQQVIEKSTGPARDALIAHVWGSDSEEWKHRNDIKLIFNKPVISTEKDLAEVGARFAASVNSFVQAGVSPDVAIDLSKTFFPSVKITDDMVKRAKESYDKMMAQSNKAPGEGETSNGKKIGASNNGPKTQAPSNRIF